MYRISGNILSVPATFNLNQQLQPTNATGQTGPSDAQLRATQYQAEQALFQLFTATQPPPIPSLTRYTLSALSVEPDHQNTGQQLIKLGCTGESMPVSTAVATQVKAHLDTITQTRQQQSQRTTSQPPPVHFRTQNNYDALPLGRLPGNRRLALALDHYRNAARGRESWTYLQPYLISQVNAMQPPQASREDMEYLVLHYTSLADCRAFLQQQGTGTRLFTFKHGNNGVQWPQHVLAVLDSVVRGGPILFEIDEGLTEVPRFGVLLRYDGTWWLLDGDLGAPCALPDGETAAEYLAGRFAASGRISVLMPEDAPLAVPVNLSYLRLPAQPAGGIDLFDGNVMVNLSAMEQLMVQSTQLHGLLAPYYATPGLHADTDLCGALPVLLSHPNVGNAVAAMHATNPFQVLCPDAHALALVQAQQALNDEAVLFARCMATQPLPTPNEPATLGAYFFVSRARHDELFNAYGVQTGNTSAQQALSFLFGFPVSYLDLLQFAMDEECKRLPALPRQQVRDSLQTGIALDTLVRYASQRLAIAPLIYHGNPVLGTIAVTPEGAITLRNTPAANSVAATLLQNPHVDRILMQFSDSQGTSYQIGLRKDASGGWWEGDGRQQQPWRCDTLQQALARQVTTAGQGGGSGVTVQIIPFSCPMMADGLGGIQPWNDFHTHQMMIAGHHGTHKLIVSAGTLPATLGGQAGVITMEDPLAISALTPSVASAVQASQQQLSAPAQTLGVGASDVHRVVYFQSQLQQRGVDCLGLNYAYLNQLSAECLQGMLYMLLNNDSRLSLAQQNLLNQAPPLSIQDKLDLQTMLGTFYPSGQVPMTADVLLLLPDVISGKFVEECVQSYIPSQQRQTAQRTSNLDDTAKKARAAIMAHLDHRLRFLDHPLQHLSRANPGLSYGTMYTGASQHTRTGARCRFDFNQYLLNRYGAFLKNYRKPNNNVSLDEGMQTRNWNAAFSYLLAREGQVSRLDSANPVTQDPVPGHNALQSWQQNKPVVEQNLTTAGLGPNHQRNLVNGSSGFLQWLLTNLQQLTNDYQAQAPVMVMIGRTYLPKLPVCYYTLQSNEARQAAEDFRLMLPQLRVGPQLRVPNIETLGHYFKAFIKEFLLWMETNPFPPDLLIAPPNSQPVIRDADLAGMLDAFGYPHQGQVLPATHAGRRHLLAAEAQAGHLMLDPHLFPRLPESARNALINRRCTDTGSAHLRPAVQFYTGQPLTGGRLQPGVRPRFAQNARILDYLIAHNSDLDPHAITYFRSWLHAVELDWDPALPMVNPVIALLQDESVFDKSIAEFKSDYRDQHHLQTAFDLLQNAPALNQSDPLFLTKNMTMLDRFIHPDPPAPARPDEDHTLILTYMQLLETQRKEPADNPVISELWTAEDANDFVTNAEQLLSPTRNQLLTAQESDTLRSFYTAWHSRSL